MLVVFVYRTRTLWSQYGTLLTLCVEPCPHRDRCLPPVVHTQCFRAQKTHILILVLCNGNVHIHYNDTYNDRQLWYLVLEQITAYYLQFSSLSKTILKTEDLIVCLHKQ